MDTSVDDSRVASTARAWPSSSVGVPAAVGIVVCGLIAAAVAFKVCKQLDLSASSEMLVGSICLVVVPLALGRVAAGSFAAIGFVRPKIAQLVGAVLLGGTSWWWAGTLSNWLANALGFAHHAAPEQEEIAIMLVTGVILAPLAEEIVFRGVLLGSLTRRFGPWVAVVVTAVIFAGLHADSARHVLGVLPDAAMLGAVMYWSRSLWVAITMHALHNGVVTALSVARLHLHPTVTTMTGAFALSLLGIAILFRARRQ